MDNGLIKALQNNIKVSNSSNTTYNGLTNAGSQYLAKCLANKTGVTFTKIKVGNGSIPSGSTGQDTTDLYGFKKEIEILEKAQVENAIKLTVLLNNIDLEAGFYVKELGVYIQDGEEEKLYWYINKANPSYLPDKNTPSSHRYNLYLEVSPIETTIVNFTGQGLLADKKYVDDSIKNFQTENNEVIKQLQNAIDGKAAKEHKHNISDINEFPTSMKNPNSLKIKLNNVEKVTYDGETAKEINITAGDVGALEKGAGLPSTIQSNEDLYNLVQNTMGCKMDKNLLYLNDRGVKTKGYVYFDKNKTGLFECIKTTTEDYVINSTEYFVEYGAKQNSDRLSNLESSRGYNEFVLSKNYNNSLQHFFKNQKITSLYACPEYFTDLTFLPNQSSNWEFILLYQGSYGLRVMANCEAYFYLIYSWNNSLDEKTQYKKIS